MKELTIEYGNNFFQVYVTLSDISGKRIRNDILNLKRGRF